MLPRSEKDNAFFFWAFFTFCLIAPASAAEAQSGSGTGTTLDFANGLYARQMYEPAIGEYEKFIQANPGSPEMPSARFRYADSFFFTKDYASAIANFELFLKGFPDDKRVPMAQFRLASARYHSGSLPMAIRLFRRLASSEDPVIQSGSKFYLAKALEKKGLQERALAILERLSQTAKDNEYASYAGVAIGDAYLQQARYADAVAGYKVAAERDHPKELAEEARFKVAEIYFAQKIYDEAAAHYQKVLEGEDPTLRAKALLGLFYCDFYREDLVAMQSRLTEANSTREFSQRKPDILFLVASLLAQKGVQGEAIQYLDEVIADPSASPELAEKAKFKKIALLAEQGRQDQALNELDTHFSATGPANEQALFQKADLLAEIGRHDDALAAYARVMSDFPGTANARFAQFQTAATYLKMGKKPEARTAFASFVNKYASDPSAELAELQVVQIDLDAQAFQKALEGAEAFVKAHPQSPMLDIAYYKLGVAATGLKHYGHAAFAFRKVVEGFPSSKLYIESLYGLAVSLESDKKIAEALPHYEKLVSENPQHALALEAWSRLGYLYIQTGDIDKLREHYKNLLLRYTHVAVDPDGVFWLIQALLDRGDYGELDRILDAIPARFPDRDLKHELAFFRGESALGKKDLAAAALHYGEAVQARADGAYLPQAYLGLGIAHAAQGNTSEADRNFNEALKFDDQTQITARARFEMANLRLAAGDLENAAKGFMMVAILYDDAKYTPPALFKAGECFRSLKKLEESRKAFDELKSRYPESEWAKKVPGRERG